MRFFTATTAFLLSCALAVQAAPAVGDAALAQRANDVVIIDDQSKKGTDVLVVLNGLNGNNKKNNNKKNNSNKNKNKNKNNTKTTVVIIVVQAGVNVDSKGKQQGNPYLLTSQSVQDAGQASTSTSWVINNSTVTAAAAGACDVGTAAVASATGGAAVLASDPNSPFSNSTAPEA